MVNLSLILPVHNEENIIIPVYLSIKKTLDRLKISWECILVENGSLDHSLKVIKKIALNYKNTKAIVSPKGYGCAVLAGLNIAKGKYLCYMPSDGQTDLKDFPKLWQLINTGKWEVVKIKRLQRESFFRLITSLSFSLITKLLFQIPFLDINGDPRIFLKKHFVALNLKSKDSFINAEFTIKAHLRGWRFKEIPVKTLPRAGGISTRNLHTFLEFFVNLWKLKTGKELELWKKQAK